MFQMAPMNWTFLYFFFIMIFMIFNVKNYFSFFTTLKIKNFKMSFKKINWKW
uniref:ATP synthase F0 subunit 8 n=1 Tax=Stenus boops TaxID=878996 RepID=A0A191ZS33_9COLE|nr:ATP synthase F0 subunit 8 [Stenus boops]